MDKKDLDELNKLEFEAEQEQFEKYGMDLRKVDRKAVAKKSRKLAKFLKRIGYLLNSTAIVFFVLVIVGLLLFLCFLWANLYEKSNINVQKQMEAQYNVKLELVGKETSGRAENGYYYFQTKDAPYIKFTANKFYGSFSTDFLDQSIKYYFESWNSDNKKYFVVDESINDNILNYEVYLDFKKCKDIDEVAEIFVEFVTFCGDGYKPYWDVYIQLDENSNNRIYPYISMNTTHEEAIKNVKDLYDKHLKFLNGIK